MMRLNQRNKTLFLLLIFFASGVFYASAQKTFKYEAFVPKVDSTGFYKISLMPDVVAKSKSDLSDIRLMDENGDFVPYVTAGNLPQTEKQKFVVFPPVAAAPDSGTSFIVESKITTPVNTLWVKLNNTAVTRTVNLSGSDDLKKWYAIEEGIPLQQGVLSSDGTYQQSFSFPASSYHYFKLLVSDKNKTPVKFLQAGEYIATTSSPVYWPVPISSVDRKDSAKTTYINISLNDIYLVNLLHLNIISPKLYKRAIAVYQIDDQGHKLICNTELSSGKSGDIPVSAKTRALELQIANDDNTPLTINDVNVYQAGQYIVSYLGKGKLYKLFTGDVNAMAPVYDLKFFTDGIRNVRQAGISPLMKNNDYQNQPIRNPYQRSIVIWAAIGIALLLLSILTLKMVKEVNKKTGG